MRTALHWLRHSVGLALPETQVSSIEWKTLARLASSRRRIVELGVYEAATTRLLAEASPDDAVVYAVDPFSAGRIGVSWGALIAHTEARRSAARRKIRFIRALSWEAAPMIHGDVDMVFVDADHSWEGIERDWQVWSPRVPVGGVIALHDTGTPREGNVRLPSYAFFREVVAVDPRFACVEQVDTLSVMQRVARP